MNNGPRTPESGEDILDWAREITQYVRQLAPRDGPDILALLTSTGAQHRLRKKPPVVYPQQPGPWAVIYSPPDDDADPANPGIGWVQVSLDSWLTQSVIPAESYTLPTGGGTVANKITITGLGAPIQLALGKRIWLEINLSPIYAGTPGPPTASIQHGTQWGAGDGDNFWPIPVDYNTDDGTYLGSTGTQPDGTVQETIYVELGYVDTRENDAFGLIAAGFGLPLGIDDENNELFFIQTLRRHDLIITSGQCIAGYTAYFVAPAIGAPHPLPE